MSSGAEEGNQAMKLYSHWMSSCSRRVRLALNLKGLKYDCINVTSVHDPGHVLVNLMLRQNRACMVFSLRKGSNVMILLSRDFLKLNPMGYVPVLVDDTSVVSDSFAIVLYLEEKYPLHSLLPQDLTRRTINYQVASVVSSSIQPLQNTSLVNYIGEIVSPDEKLPWAQYHIRKGFVALEKLLMNYAGKYATGDEIYLADLYLAPQLHNAINLYKLDMTEFPILSKLNKTYSELPSFQEIMAETQQQDTGKSFDFVKLQEA